jgi:hypothetical protein
MGSLFSCIEGNEHIPNCNAKWYENAWCLAGNDLELNEREMKV